MFEKAMVDRLKRIFDMEKVSFNHPGESKEQEGIFIQVVKSDVRIRDARQIAHVEGSLHIFANADKLPYGFFAKKIQAADLFDTRGFFFGAEENMGTFVNIAERKFDFTFLFDSQYDPAIGTIDEITLSYPET